MPRVRHAREVLSAIAGTLADERAPGARITMGEGDDSDDLGR